MVRVKIEPTRRGFIALARIRLKTVGSYDLCEIIRDQFGSDMVSDRPGKGIPRRLISAATRELQRLADRRDRKIIHYIKIEKDEPEQKLSHIFLEHDYTPYLNELTKRTNFRRDYHPNK